MAISQPKAFDQRLELSQILVVLLKSAQCGLLMVVVLNRQLVVILTAFLNQLQFFQIQVEKTATSL